MKSAVSEEDARGLLEHLQRHAGQRLRGAVRYRRDASTVLYVRDDVDAAYSNDEVDAAIDDLVLEAWGDPERLSNLYQLGSLDASVRWFENGILLNFAYGTDGGVAFTFDRDAGEDVPTFVSLGVEYLDG